MKKYSGIRQRKDKDGKVVNPDSWEINYRPRIGAKSIFVHVQANSRQEAYLKRAELMLEARKAPALDFSEAIAREELTFETIWPSIERNMVAEGRPQATIDEKRRIYHRLFTEFRIKRFPNIISPSQLDFSFFIEYQSYYSIDLKRLRGLRSELRSVKSIVQRMRTLRYVSEDIIRDLKKLNIPIRNKKAFAEITQTDLKALFARIKKERPDLYGVIYFIFRTGRRIQETTLIQRKDVIWDDKLNPIKLNIRAETTKMKTEAPLDYLDAELQSHIRYYYQLSSKHHSPFLFLNQQNIKIRRNMATEYLGKISVEMGLPKITCHYFRHRFCTETCKARLPIIDIQAISGIRKIATILENYCHSSRDGQASVLERTRL